MDGFESMPVLLYKLKVKERQGESSRKEVHNVYQEYAKIEDEIKACGQRSNDSEDSISHLQDLFQEKKFEWEYLGTKEIKLQQMLPETQQALENEQVVLEDTQFMVWQERQDFCDNVLEFLNNHGLLSKPKPPQVQIKAEESAVDPELCAIEADVTTMETSYQNLELKVIAHETQVDVAKQEIRLLKNETSVGKEFVRLQKTLRVSQEQNNVVEVEYERAQQSILKSSSKTRPTQSVSFKQQSKRPSSLSKHSSFHQLQHHSDYEADLSDENPMSDEVCYAPCLRETLLSGQLSRQSSTLPWTERDVASMSAEEDQKQVLATTKSTSDTDNSRRLIYEEHSSSKMNFNLNHNQGEKRSFIPKTPSAISKKFMLKKDRCLLLEKDICAMLLPPMKPEPGLRESNGDNKLQSATHLQQGHSNLANPNSAQHGKAWKMKQNPNVQKEKPRNAYTPYIT